MAARQNPDLRSAFFAQEASRATYKGSYNGVLPHLSLSNSYTDASSSPKTWDAAGNASLDLIDFSQWANIQSAAASLKQSQAGRELAAANALLSLYRGFTSLLYAQEAILVNTTIRDIWHTDAQLIGLRYQSGRESKGNNMNTQAQYLQSDIALQQAGRDLHVSQQQLSQALGYDNFSALAVTGTWSAASVPTPRPDFTAILAKVPQVRVQEAVLEQARAAIKSAHSTLWPTLSLNYSKGTQGTSEFPSSPFWTFTGVVNYPLFGNGPTATYYASQAAERAYDKAKEDLRSTRNQMLSTLESAWSAFALAQDQVRVQSAFLAAAKQRKEESDIRYQSGLMTFEEWNLVVQDFVNFQTSFLRSEQNLILAEAQWRFATGEQLGESL